MAIPVQRYHPRLRLYQLLLGAWVIRLLTSVRSWFNPDKKQQQVLTAAGVTQSRILVPSREAGRSIKIDVYQKRSTSTDAKQRVHLNFHGSGFVVPSLGSDADFCATLAGANVVVFDADYRKAPEYPFPACYEDAQDVVRYIRSQDTFDTSRLTVSGFSAGGNIAMALAVNLPVNEIAGVVAFYGNTDMTTVYAAPDPETFDSGVILPEWLRRFFYRCYILPGQDRADTRLSPVKAALTRWPKHVFMACGTADSLYESGRVVIEDLKKHVHPDAEFMPIEKAAHAFDKDTKEGSSAEDRKYSMYKAAVDVICRAQGAR